MPPIGASASADRDCRRRGRRLQAAPVAVLSGQSRMGAPHLWQASLHLAATDSSCPPGHGRGSAPLLPQDIPCQVHAGDLRGTWPRLRTPPAAARSPAHAFAEPRAGVWLCTTRLQVWMPPGMLAAAWAPIPGCMLPGACRQAGDAAMWPGWPAARPSRHAGLGRSSRSMTCLTRAGSGRSGRGHEKSGGHTPPRGKSPIPKTGAKDAWRLPPTRSQPTRAFPDSAGEMGRIMRGRAAKQRNTRMLPDWAGAHALEMLQAIHAACAASGCRDLEPGRKMPGRPPPASE